MVVIRGFDIPEHLHYWVDKHVWVSSPQGGVARIGLTPVAYHLLRHSLVAISIKASVIGNEVAKGKSVAMVESLKYIGGVPAPFTGLVVRGNPLLSEAPSIAEQDPYGEGWIVEMTTEDWDAVAAGLVTGEAGIEVYRKLLESQNIDTTT